MMPARLNKVKPPEKPKLPRGPGCSIFGILTKSNRKMWTVKE